MGLAILPFRDAPEWLLVLMAALVGISVATYIGGYLYFAVKDPDALRSEKFTLSKMAIEKNLIGDNTAGLFEFEEGRELNRLPALPNATDAGAPK